MAAIACVAVLSLGLNAAPAHAGDVEILRIGIGIDPDTLNPMELTTAIPSNISELIHDRLLLPGPGGTLMPNLITEWSPSEDGKFYTVKLRQGVKFTDGAPFNAQALKKGVEMVQDPKVRVPFRFIFDAIDHLEIIDDHTVKYHLKYQYAPFTRVMTVSLPMSPKALENYDPRRHSVPQG